MAATDNFMGAWSQLYAAYEYLKTSVKPDQSGTAQMLNAPDWRKLRSRLSDELAELAGVVEGTHHHNGMPQDLILEASQVCYWTFTLAVAAGFKADDILVDLEAANPDNPRMIADQLRSMAQQAVVLDGPPTQPELEAAWETTLACCVAFDIDTTAPVKYDLEQMQARDYMQPFFSQSNGN